MERRRLAHPSDATPWDLAGRLGIFGLSDILQMLGFSGKTGTLTLIQGWNTRTISYRHGKVCYIAAGTRLPTVLDLLHRGGHVSRVDLAAVAAQGMQNEHEVIRRLVADKTVTLEDVQLCVERQLESTIYSLFLWRSCSFTFAAGELVLEGWVAIELDSQHLIIEGTRRVDEWIGISPVVPSVLVAFQRRPVIVPSLKDDEVPVYHRIDGFRDVATIAREIGKTRFETAKLHYNPVKRGIIEAVPPNKYKIIQLFSLVLESMHMKLMMYGHSREALELQNQLNRFAQDTRLKMRMSGGRVTLTDLDTPLNGTALIDLYKLFIGIQNNKFSKIIEPEKAAGLLEGLYRHADPEFRLMMRMYEFFEIEGLLSIDLFQGLRGASAAPRSA